MGTGGTPQTPQLEPTEAAPYKKGILLVHGMGEQKKDATLRVMATPIIKWLWHVKNKSPQVTTDYLPAGEGASSLTVKYDNYDLKFVEAWWKPLVIAPAFDPMIVWTVQRARIQLLGLMKLAYKRAFLPTVGILAITAVLVLFFPVALFIYSAARINSRFAKGSSETNAKLPDLASTSTLHIRIAVSRVQTLKDLMDMDKGQEATSPREAMNAVLKSVRRKMIPGEGDTELVDDVLAARWFWPWALRVLLLLLAMVYQLLNSIIAIVVYIVGAVLVLPILVVLFLLARIVSVPGVPSIITSIKAILDKFLIGSLGDIRVYLEDPLQAATIRAELEEAARNLHKEGYTELYIVAHSTGAAIAYEALNHESNQSWSKDVRKLITAGSIMRLVWQGVRRERRSTFTTALKPVWINFWTRYDLAYPGPIEESYRKHTADGKEPTEVVDVAVTNEDDPLGDHTSYWRNYHQVIPRILEEILDEGSRDGTEHYQRQPTLARSHEDEVVRNDKKWKASLQRKHIVLWLTVPRLVLTWLPWPVLPLLFFYVLTDSRAWLVDRLEDILDLVNQDERLGWLINHEGAWDHLLESVIATAVIFVIGYLIYTFWKLYWQMRIGGLARILPD